MPTEGGTLFTTIHSSGLKGGAYRIEVKGGTGGRGGSTKINSENGGLGAEGEIASTTRLFKKYVRFYFHTGNDGNDGERGEGDSGDDNTMSGGGGGAAGDSSYVSYEVINRNTNKSGLRTTLLSARGGSGGGGSSSDGPNFEFIIKEEASAGGGGGGGGYGTAEDGQSRGTGDGGKGGSDGNNGKSGNGDDIDETKGSPFYFGMFGIDSSIQGAGGHGGSMFELKIPPPIAIYDAYGGGKGGEGFKTTSSGYARIYKLW